MRCNAPSSRSCATDNRTNVFYIAGEYGGLALVLWGCGAAFQRWSSGELENSFFLPLAAFGVFLVAAFQHRLSGLAHDASHYTLFRNRLANELVSDLFLMFPLVAMTQRTGPPTWATTSSSTTRVATPT